MPSPSADTAAAQAVVDAARRVPLADLLQATRSTAATLDTVGLTLASWKQLKDSTREALFSIFKANMKDLYRLSSFGWKPAKKKDELADPRMLHLVLTDKASGAVVGYASFMFDVEDGQPVLYLYEVQVSKTQRKKGLGRQLMQSLDTICGQVQLDKIMLTCLHKNETAQTFFKRAGYTLDPFSPPKDEADYDILSKARAKPADAVSAADASSPTEAGNSK